MIQFVLILLLVTLGLTSGLHVEESVTLKGYICHASRVHKPCELCPTGKSAFVLFYQVNSSVQPMTLVCLYKPHVLTYVHLSSLQNCCNAHLPGYFCSNKETIQPCGGNNVYCPLGSTSPTNVTVGYYSIGDEEDKRYSQQICEAGFYCVDGVKNTCPRGYYCPTTGLSSPIECGYSNLYCLEGATESTQVSTGYYSIGGTNTTRQRQEIAPKGYYASDGVVLPCHSGHYGDKDGLSNDECSGLCESGWYCPTASTSPRQVACGNEDRYCPTGSSSPLSIQLGYYTSTEEDPCRPGTYREEPVASGDIDISPISTQRMDGKCKLCPEGTYKHISGDDLSLCTDCGTHAKSTPSRTTCECHQSATDKTLFTLQYNVVESTCYRLSEADELPPDDFHLPNTQLTAVKEYPCEKGHYCQDGIRYKCPSGRYGDRDLETNKECTGVCPGGHYCNEGMMIPTKCGSPHLYCPQGTSTPIYVSEGHYTDEDEPNDIKTSQHICPKGFWCSGEDGLRHPCPSATFGDELGMSDESCSGMCSSGYYCLEGSTSPTQYPCGNSTVYCPNGSRTPILVEEGYYSALESDAVLADYYAGPNSTQQIQEICEVGFYCNDGIKYSCPEGTYGDKIGASDISDCKPCTPGFYCPSHPGPPSTLDTQVPCGEVHLYCPKGSSKPLSVDLGFYSIDAELTQDINTGHIRTDQVECELGFYCQNGIRYPCRAGTYGESLGLASEDCSGLCPRGSFCPVNSIHPLPCSPGAYSTGGATDCTSCDLPPNVPHDVIKNMCRDDRSCCLDALGS